MIGAYWRIETVRHIQRHQCRLLTRQNFFVQKEVFTSIVYGLSGGPFQDNVIAVLYTEYCDLRGDISLTVSVVQKAHLTSGVALEPDAVVEGKVARVAYARHIPQVSRRPAAQVALDGRCTYMYTERHDELITSEPSQIRSLWSSWNWQPQTFVFIKDEGWPTRNKLFFFLLWRGNDPAEDNALFPGTAHYTHELDYLL